MKAPAFIFARGGSKEVPRKNVVEIGGKPLISYAIIAAKQCRYVNEVIVSTDDPEIAKISRNYGASVPYIRPKHLALDDSPEIESWRHAIEMCTDDLPFFMSVPTTSPLRLPSDLDNCVELFLCEEPDLALVVTEAARNPRFNMLQLNQAGFAELVVQDNFSRRQDAPLCFDVTTVCYVANPEYVITTNHLLSGRIKVLEIPRSRALDIDSEFDLRIAKALMEKEIGGD